MTVEYKLLRPTDQSGKLKSEPVSIQIIVCNKNTRVRLTTGLKIIPKFWGKGEAKTSLIDSSFINNELTRYKSEIAEAWKLNKNISGEILKGLVCGIVQGDNQPDQKKTVISAVQMLIAQYEREKDKGTLSKYKALLKRLTEFNEHLTFEQLDMNFYDAFKKFLYDIPNPNYAGHHLEFDSMDGVYIVTAGDVRGKHIGLFDEVVFKYFVNLKTVCAWAEKRGYTPHQAYKEWEVIKRDYSPISLTLDELRRIEDATLPIHLDIARDFLALESRTGQRISDLRRFSRADIDGNLWTFNQKKGSRTLTKRINLPLIGYCAPALAILQKYNYELPKITEQQLNRNIKEVCRIAGITQQFSIDRWAGAKKIRISGPKCSFISTHTGRKTFVTVALQFMTPKLVMDITGIRSFKTLRHYMGDSEIGMIESGLLSIESGITLMKKVQ